MKIHFNQVGNLAGFAAENAAEGDIVKILTGRTSVIKQNNAWKAWIGLFAALLFLIGILISTKYLLWNPLLNSHVGDTAIQMEVDK